MLALPYMVLFIKRGFKLILYETKFLSLKAAKRDGKSDWYYVVRPNAKNIVAILPIIKKEEDEVLFLITNRPPLEHEHVAKFSVEIPAGLVGDENKAETDDEACKKELLEETGLVAEKIELCASKISTSAGLSDEVCSIYKAYIKDDEIQVPPIDDGGVIIDRIRVKKSKIKDFLKQKEQEGGSISALALAALYYLE